MSRGGVDESIDKVHLWLNDTDTATKELTAPPQQSSGPAPASVPSTGLSPKEEVQPIPRPPSDISPPHRRSPQVALQPTDSSMLSPTHEPASTHGEGEYHTMSDASSIVPLSLEQPASADSGAGSLVGISPQSGSNGNAMEIQLSLLRRRRMEREKSKEDPKMRLPTPPAAPQTNPARPQVGPSQPDGPGGATAPTQPPALLTASLHSRRLRAKSDGQTSEPFKPPESAKKKNQSTPELITATDVPPLPQASQLLQQIGESLVQPNWSKQQEALQSLHAILQSLLSGPNDAAVHLTVDPLAPPPSKPQTACPSADDIRCCHLKPLVEGVLHACDNPRTSVAKLAIETLGSLCRVMKSSSMLELPSGNASPEAQHPVESPQALGQGVGRRTPRQSLRPKGNMETLDTFVEPIATKLILKGGANGAKFLFEVAQFAIRELVAASAVMKTLPTILLMQMPKTDKGKVLWGEAISLCLERQDVVIVAPASTTSAFASGKEIVPKLVNAIDTLLHDPWPDVRDCGKRVAALTAQHCAESKAGESLSKIIPRTLNSAVHIERVMSCCGLEGQCVPSPPRESAASKRPQPKSSEDLESNTVPTPTALEKTKVPCQQDANTDSSKADTKTEGVPSRQQTHKEGCADTKPDGGAQMSPPANTNAKAVAKRSNSSHKLRVEASPEKARAASEDEKAVVKPRRKSTSKTIDPGENAQKRPSNKASHNDNPASARSNEPQQRRTASKPALRKEDGSSQVPTLPEIPPPPRCDSLSSGTKNSTPREQEHDNWIKGSGPSASFEPPGSASAKRTPCDAPLISPMEHNLDQSNGSFSASPSFAFSTTLGVQMKEHGAFSVPIYVAQEGSYKERCEAIRQVRTLCEQRLLSYFGETPPPSSLPDHSDVKKDTVEDSKSSVLVSNATGHALCDVLALRCADTNTKVQQAALEAVPTVLRVVPADCIDATAPKWISCLTTALSSSYEATHQAALAALSGVLRLTPKSDPRNLLQTISTTAVSVRNSKAKVALVEALCALIECSYVPLSDAAPGTRVTFLPDEKDSSLLPPSETHTAYKLTQRRSVVLQERRLAKNDANYLASMAIKLVVDERPEVRVPSEKLIVMLSNYALGESILNESSLRPEVFIRIRDIIRPPQKA